MRTSTPSERRRKKGSLALGETSKRRVCGGRRISLEHGHEPFALGCVLAGLLKRGHYSSGSGSCRYGLIREKRYCFRIFGCEGFRTQVTIIILTVPSPVAPSHPLNFASKTILYPSTPSCLAIGARRSIPLQDTSIASTAKEITNFKPPSHHI